MRLMLGSGTQPSLLIDVDNNYDPTSFDFYVVNGAWSGVYKDGYVYVEQDTKHTGSKVEILTDNQDRLRGDYNDVFYNFDNLDYVAPVYKKVVFDDMDDDIPF